jgi:hypothetical protein
MDGGVGRVCGLGGGCGPGGQGFSASDQKHDDGLPEEWRDLADGALRSVSRIDRRCRRAGVERLVGGNFFGHRKPATYSVYGSDNTPAP